MQKKWIHLESIFHTDDIRKQIPAEVMKFEKFSIIFNDIMKSIRKDPIAKNSCLKPGVLNTLHNLDKTFDICQRSLNHYLDFKRQSFPRFYFLSDNELLLILGGNQPFSIIDHVSKIFDNVSSLSIHQHQIKSLISSEGEELTLNNPINVQRPIEDWMNDLVDEMHKTIHDLIKLAIFNYGLGKSRVDWVNDYQGMISLSSSKTWRTWEVEDTFFKLKSNKNAMKSYRKQVEIEINHVVTEIVGNMNEIFRKKLINLIILDVHSRDIIDNLIRDNILNNDEFEWDSQIRFYWNKNINNLIINQCTSHFRYGYEYLGLSSRLVITPLTDRIYLTLTQALAMNLGGGKLQKFVKN